MNKTTRDEKTQRKEKLLYNVIYLLLGLLTLVAGLLVFYAKMAGSRYGASVEGGAAQIIGLILILFGIYRTLSAVRNLRILIRNKKRNESGE